MDGQAEGGSDSPDHATQQELTFHWLYQRVQGLAEHSIYPKAGSLEKWSFRVAMMAAAIGILGSQLPERWIPLTATLLLVRVCLAVEIGGFLVGGLLAAAAESVSSASHGCRMPGKWMTSLPIGKL